MIMTTCATGKNFHFMLGICSEQKDTSVLFPKETISNQTKVFQLTILIKLLYFNEAKWRKQSLMETTTVRYSRCVINLSTLGLPTALSFTSICKHIPCNNIQTCSVLIISGVRFLLGQKIICI